MILLRVARNTGTGARCTLTAGKGARVHHTVGGMLHADTDLAVVDGLELKEYARVALAITVAGLAEAGLFKDPARGVVVFEDDGAQRRLGLLGKVIFHDAPQGLSHDAVIPETLAQLKAHGERVKLFHGTQGDPAARTGIAIVNRPAVRRGNVQRRLEPGTQTAANGLQSVSPHFVVEQEFFEPWRVAGVQRPQAKARGFKDRDAVHLF